MPTVETENFLCITKFAQEAGLTRQAIHKAIREGRLKYITISGIKFMDKNDLEKFRK
jgi:biotin operon repressor